MKGQAPKAKYTGEERVHSDGGSWFKKIIEATRKPSIIDSESIKKAQNVLAREAKSEFDVAISQLFGVEMKEGHAVSLSKKAENDTPVVERPVEKPQMTAEHMDYFSSFKRSAERKEEDQNTTAIRQQIEAIQMQLRQLKDSSDELETVFKDVVIDTPPEKPGVYHLTFFEGFLKLVIKMKDKVEDGVIFAKLFKSRKAERSYHSMAKKAGTSYTLHHDRAVATQTG